MRTTVLILSGKCAGERGTIAGTWADNEARARRLFGMKWGTMKVPVKFNLPHPKDFVEKQLGTMQEVPAALL